MSTGWERIRLRVETKEGLEPEPNNMTNDTRTISCHVLDTALGKAAARVPVILYRQANNGDWQELTQAQTNEDGRASQLLEAAAFQTGVYRLRFNVQMYFDASRAESFYPYIDVVFKCQQGQHYHVPLLLSNFGYTTYRGT